MPRGRGRVATPAPLLGSRTFSGMPVNEPAQVYRSVGLADLLTDLLNGFEVDAGTAMFECSSSDDRAVSSCPDVAESASGPTTMPP